MSLQHWVRLTPREAACRITRRNSTRTSGSGAVAAPASWAALSAFTLALPSQTVLASEAPAALPIEAAQSAIVITGTRSDRASDAEPYAVEVIDLEQLERTLPRTVPEALNRLPGVLVQKTASGHGSPYIRGFTGNRTLLVIDGIRYNNATYRDGANEYFAQIDSFTLDRIELIAGPSSSLYGSEAVGGVLSLTTRPTKLGEADGMIAGGEQITRISSGDGSFASRSAVDLARGGAWGFRGGVTLRDYGDIRAAELGRLPYTGYSERAFDARLDLSLSPNWTATVNHQSLWQDGVPRTHSTVFSVPFAGTTVGTDRLREKDHRRGLTYLKIAGTTASPWLASLDVTLSHQDRSEREQRLRGDGIAIDQWFDSDLFAFNATATAELAGIKLAYGVDLSREQIVSARSDTDTATGAVTRRLQGPVGDDARHDQAGVFVRAIAEIAPQLALEASARLSWIGLDIGQFTDPVTAQPLSFADKWSDLSGSARAIYRVDGHAVWAAYSRSFRAPNVADVSRFGRSRSNEIEVASLTLEPETFDTFELAYRFTNSAFQARVSAYSTRLNDYIATVPTGRPRGSLVEVAKQNVAQGRISGVELSLRGNLGSGFTAEANATWLRGRLTLPNTGGSAREEPISRIQPLTGHLTLSWQKRSTWVTAELALVDRADELSSDDLLDTQRIPIGGTPGYALLNLRGGAELMPGLDVTLALNNLLDQAYRAHGSGSNEPGRHVLAGLHLRF